jgi:CMP/dCMP kinase
MDRRIVICISRAYGSGARSVGKLLAEKLGIPYYDKELLVETAREQGIDENVLEAVDETPTSLLSFSYPIDPGYPYTTENLDTMYYLMSDSFYHQIEKAIRKIAEQGSCVFIGRAADEILREDPDMISIFIYANEADRVKRVMEEQKVDTKAACKLMQKTDKKRASYHNYYSDLKWGESCSYDLSLSTSRFGVDGAAAVIIDAIEKIRTKN